MHEHKVRDNWWYGVIYSECKLNLQYINPFKKTRRECLTCNALTMIVKSSYRGETSNECLRSGMNKVG